MENEARTTELLAEINQARRDVLNAAYHKFIGEIIDKAKGDPFQVSFSSTIKEKPYAEYYLMRLLDEKIEAKLETCGMMSTGYTINFNLPLGFEVKLTEPEKEGEGNK